MSSSVGAFRVAGTGAAGARHNGKVNIQRLKLMTVTDTGPRTGSYVTDNKRRQRPHKRQWL